MPRWPRHSCGATGTGAPGGRGAWGSGRPRTPAPADRARRTHRDDRASDRRRRKTRDNRSTILPIAVPTQGSSFRLLTLPCRYAILVGSDSNNNKLCDAIGVKRGETVGVLRHAKRRGFRVEKTCGNSFSQSLQGCYRTVKFLYTSLTFAVPEMQSSAHKSAAKDGATVPCQAQAEGVAYILVDHTHQRHIPPQRKAGRYTNSDHRDAYPYA